MKVFYPQGEKNVREVSSKKISLNVIGALAPSGCSHISFPERTNAFTMSIFILEVLKVNCKDSVIVDELDWILNHEKIDPDFVEKGMKMEIALNEENFTAKIDSINNLNISCEDKKGKLERLLRNFSVSINKLLYRLRANQKEIIFASNLYKKFEKTCIVWDNAKSHIAHHVRDMMNFLGVKIGPLPVRCPEYNPIEYVWRDGKYQTAKEPVDSETELKELFEFYFYESIEKNNYSDYWFELIENERKNYL